VLHENEYGATPPAGFAVALPFSAPWQDTLFTPEMLIEIAEEICAIVSLAVFVQPFASVIVTV
jgi:hypothetical protein